MDIHKARVSLTKSQISLASNLNAKLQYDMQVKSGHRVNISNEECNQIKINIDINKSVIASARKLLGYK